MVKLNFRIGIPHISSSQKAAISLAIVILFVIISSFLRHSSNIPSRAMLVQESFINYHKTFDIRIPKKLLFADEIVPIKSPHVRELIAKELALNSYRKSNSTLLHRRAKKWFPIIEPILEKHNVPDDFKYLSLVESKLKQNAISKQGAAGIWQIMPITGREYGLMINDTIDERFNIRRSTHVACKYFIRSYKVFKNWALVAASYNRGINGVQRLIKKQKTNNYYELDLSKETNRYLYKVLVMKELISRPNVYGFKIKP